MKTKKRIILGSVILLLLIIFFIGGEMILNSKKPSIDLSELIKYENIEDISLTIFYVNPNIFTLIPWSVENLISSTQTKKIEVNGGDLEEYINLFDQLSEDNLIPVKKKSYLNARLYYVLESKKNGKLFDVAMWGGAGDDYSIFVNGIEVKENEIFYHIVMPFLPEDAMKELKSFRAGLWPE